MNRYMEIIEQAQDAIGVRRVFGEPYEKNGVTIIPAARVMGGAGGGEGVGPPADGDPTATPVGGSGGAFGLGGRPAGAFVIHGEDVRWMPAIDVNRLMFGFQAVLIVFFLVMRSIVKTRAKTVQAALKPAA